MIRRILLVVLAVLQLWTQPQGVTLQLWNPKNGASPAGRREPKYPKSITNLGNLLIPFMFKSYFLIISMFLAPLSKKIMDNHYLVSSSITCWETVNLWFLPLLAVTGFQCMNAQKLEGSSCSRHMQTLMWVYLLKFHSVSHHFHISIINHSQKKTFIHVLGPMTKKLANLFWQLLVPGVLFE